MSSYFISRLSKRNYLYSKKEYASSRKQEDENNNNTSLIDWDIVAGKKKVLVITRKRTLRDRMKRMF
jgi:hypothetical protein